MASDWKNRSFSYETFFDVTIEKLVALKTHDFPLFIYFQVNQHLILRYPMDEEITAQQLSRYRERGLMCFWCPKEFYPQWIKYLEDHQLATSTEAKTMLEQGPPKPEHEDSSARARSAESAMVIDAIADPELTQEQKKEIVSGVSRNITAMLISVEKGDKESANATLEKCKEFTEDIIRVATSSSKSGSIYQDILMTLQLNTEHSVAVSTFSALFALTIGITDYTVISDLAVAALMHDIGFSGLDPTTAQKIKAEMTEEELQKYRQHPLESLKIIARFGIAVNPEVAQIIEQHHERYDGTGYPNQLKGDQIEEAAQILSFADLAHDLITGRYDGVERTFDEALAFLADLQSQGQGPRLISWTLFMALKLSLLNQQKLSKAA